MANLYLRGSTYWMQFRVNGRRYQESTGTHDKAKAAIALKAKLGEVARLRHGKKLGLPMPELGRDARLTLDEFLKKYEEHYVNAGGPALRESRLRSWKADAAALRSVVDFLKMKGVTQVARVEARHVEAFRDWRLATPVKKRRVKVEPPAKKGAKPERKAVEVEVRLSAATVNKAIRVARAAWSWAIGSGFTRQAHPFDGIKAVKTPQYEPRVLSDVDVKKLLEAARGDWHYPLIALALFAGLRRAELIALEWPDVDLVAGQIRVRCDETFHTKSRKPRTVPVAPELASILRPLRRPAGLVVPSPRPKEGASESTLERTALTHAFERIGAAAGVKLTPHDCRRTFASMLAARGVPTTRIRDYLGHASTATTETYYVERGAVEADDVAGLSFGIAAGRKGRPGMAEAS